MGSDIFPESKMGFGCMRLPLLDAEDPKSIDIEQFKEMVDVFMASGNTYFDTAYVYHNGMSEAALKEALVRSLPARLVHHCDEVPGLGAARRRVRQSVL